MAEKDPEKYATFWKEFGAVLKEGIADDYANRDDIARLLRFTSTKSGTDQADVSLADYVARMKEGQDKIYYLLAPTPGRRQTAARTWRPSARRASRCCCSGMPVDNWVVTSLREFDGKQLQSVAQGAPDFGTLEDEAEKQAKEKASHRVRRRCSAS